jgi:hypothetical protein
MELEESHIPLSTADPPSRALMVYGGVKPIEPPAMVTECPPVAARFIVMPEGLPPRREMEAEGSKVITRETDDKSRSAAVRAAPRQDKELGTTRPRAEVCEYQLLVSVAEPPTRMQREA